MIVPARRLVCLTVVLAAAVTFAGSASSAVLARSAASARSTALSSSLLPTLYVTYTMNCTFAITGDSGSPVTSIAPGTYQVQITTPVVFANVDLSGGDSGMTACQSFIQFQLTGPGVNLTTTLQDGDEDYGLIDATFQPGSTYTAVDNNQASVAHLTFTTQASGAPTAPVAPATPTTGTPTSTKSSSGPTSAIGTSISSDPLRGTLIGAVSAAGNLTLTAKGKAVTQLTSGRYTVTVTDKSKKSGFTLQEIHTAGSTVTGVAFTGKKTVTLDLKAGQWLFYPTFVGKKSYFIVVA
jgi:hypothetical protein